MLVKAESDIIVKDVEFVGGTGGSKILKNDINDNIISTEGVIYDADASLVYQITLTNDSDNYKKLFDVKGLDNDYHLKYEVLNYDKNKIIAPGDTITFLYSIKADQPDYILSIENFNEKAKAELLFENVSYINPDTFDIIVLVVIAFILCSLLFIIVYRKNKILYLIILLFLVLGYSHFSHVKASDVQHIDITTDISYILSNLAPSCANLDYDGDFCIDWKLYGDRDFVHYLVMEDYKELSDTYLIDDVSFSLQNTYDVSEQQNGDVILGVYLADTEEESYLFLIGQDGGVVVPKDASYQFSSYNAEDNNSDNDFFNIKYLDMSKFFSNKTTNMEYMLTGIGNQVDMIKYDLSGFETSNVTSMRGMFAGFAEYTEDLELDLSMFDTSNVTDMSFMFWEAGYFSETINLDLSNFDTSNVTNMSSMFLYFGSNSRELNLDIYDFDTSKVEDMTRMFAFFRYLSPVEVTIDYFKDWDTSNVKRMTGMFYHSIFGLLYEYPNITTIDLTGLDTQNVEYFDNMFIGNSRVKTIIGLDDFDTSSAINMDSMFRGVGVSDLSDIYYWDTSNLSSANYMFGSLVPSKNITNPIEELDLSNWNVEKLEKATGMFSLFSAKLNLKNWNLSSLQNSRGMFNYNYVNELDLSGVNFGTSINYSLMFSTTDGKVYPSVFDLSGSDWNEEADVTDMFKGISGSTIYVKDEKAKAFIEKQAPDCVVLIKE
ncbi:MAG: BspA family leucine-rich repeat surface protein [Candidatus Coprovivens sp.]